VHGLRENWRWCFGCWFVGMLFHKFFPAWQFGDLKSAVGNIYSVALRKLKRSKAFA
jgi:hypothetical protein